MSIANYLEDQLLDAVFNADSFSVANTYIKLHIGDPGDNNTNNAAAHTARLAATWGPASGGTVTNDIAVTYTPMTANETITHISIWDAVSGGNALWNGPLTASQAVNIGGTLNFAIGSIIVTLT